VSNFTAQYSHEIEGQTLINAEGGVDRNITSSTIYARGAVDSRFGNLRADVLHIVEGRGGTQYDLAFQSGMAVGVHASAWGGRDLEQSAIIISVNGDVPDTAFKVLVDEVQRGRVKAGERLSLFLPGYRTYKVRLVPAAASPVSYDTAAREVTLYPGNVRSLAWRAESYFTIFAQATGPNGAPITNALVQTPKGIAQTDTNGYFQVDVRRDDPIMIAKGDGPTCQVKLANVAVRNDFASVGKVVCQ
jgi:hypothetical protein